jgi:ketosteroid isomerase-like protein
LNRANSTEEIREVALALDRALEGKDLQAIIKKFAEDCEIKLLGVKLFGIEGVRKWFNWLYNHVAKLKLSPVTIMVEGNTFFEEFIVEATFHGEEKVRFNQAEVMVFENLKIKSLRLYFDRLDLSSSVAKDVISKTIVKQLVKKPLEGLT